MTLSVRADDDIDQDDVTYSIELVATPGATDPNSVRLTTIQGITLDDDTAGFTLTDPVGPLTQNANTVNEGDTKEATFTVVLDSEPTADVTFDVTSGDVSEGAVSAPGAASITRGVRLTFTPDNWDTAQTVTVTNLDDDIADGDRSFLVFVSNPTSDDAKYSAINVPVADRRWEFLNLDDDKVGVTVAPTSGLTTTEAGGTAEFTVVLDTEPTADVTVQATSRDTTEGTLGATAPGAVDIANGVRLLFTPANWDTAQTVTVTGVDDDALDGDVTYAIWVGDVASTDTNYHGFNPDDVEVTNEDDEAPPTRLTLSAANTEVLEDVGTVRVTVQLDNPAGAGGLEVTLSEGQGGTATRGASGDWDWSANTVTIAEGDREGAVTLTIRDDGDEEGSETFALAAAAGILTGDEIVFTIYDNDGDQTPFFSPASVAYTWTEGEDIGSVVLPAATGGDGALTYVLADEANIPAGVSYDDATRAFTGTPTAAGAATLTLTATDSDAADADSAVLDIDIAVNVADTAPSFSDESVSYTWTAGEAVSQQLPMATGGNGELTYGIHGTRPAGIKFDRPTRTLSGTPTEAESAATLILRAMDSDDNRTAADRAEIDVYITVIAADVAPSFSPESVEYSWTVGEDIGSVQLPAATGGNGALSYALTDRADIPDGVSYDDDTRTFTGAPSEAGAAALTLTATDSDTINPDSAGLNVRIEVGKGMQDLSGFAYTPGRVRLDGDPPVLTPPSSVAEGAALTYASTTPGVCTADENTGALTLVAAGDCTVEATAAATDDYRATTARFTVEVIAAEAEVGERLAAVNESVLPELGRAMATGAAEAVTGRLDAALSGGGPAAATGFADAMAFVAGTLQANRQSLNEGDFPWREALSGKSFALGLADGIGAGDAAFWGSGDWRRLSLDDEPIEWKGNLFSAALGIDAALATDLDADVRTGVAVSRSEGSIDYTDESGAAPAEGTLESRMTSVHPYAGLSMADGTRLWATAGWGRGEIEIEEEDEAIRQSSDSTLLTAAVGGNARLVSESGMAAAGVTALDLKGEVQGARLEIDDNGDMIAGMSVKIWRLRLAMEGSHSFALSPDETLTPSLEAGARWDGGDGLIGAGLELGGGLGWANRASGLTAAVSARALAAHGGGLREWGASGFVRLDPGADGRGLSLSVVPSWGETASGADRLWEDGVTARTVGDDGLRAPVGRLDAELGYGLAAFGAAGLVTPYGAAAFAGDGGHRYRLGGRLGLGAGFSLSLEAVRRESAADTPEHGIGLRGALRW